MRFTVKPSPLDEKISRLTPGDEVIVLKGEGFPPVIKETATVIWKVDDTTALTASGTKLTSAVISDLIVTGHKFETYFVNPEALQTWGEILAAKKEALDGNSEPDWSVPDPFAPQPE